MISMDTKALADAFAAGYAAAVRERERDPLPEIKNTGIAESDLFAARSTTGLQQGVVGGLASAILGGLIGLGLGSLIGLPVQSAATGAGLGAALGFPIGSARGQLSADKKHLSNKGIEARTPIPAKELLLNPGLSAAIARTSYTSLRRKP